MFRKFLVTSVFFASSFSVKADDVFLNETTFDRNAFNYWTLGLPQEAGKIVYPIYVGNEAAIYRICREDRNAKRGPIIGTDTDLLRVSVDGNLVEDRSGQPIGLDIGSCITVEGAAIFLDYVGTKKPEYPVLDGSFEQISIPSFISREYREYSRWKAYTDQQGPGFHNIVLMDTRQERLFQVCIDNRRVYPPIENTGVRVEIEVDNNPITYDGTAVTFRGYGCTDVRGKKVALNMVRWLPNYEAMFVEGKLAVVASEP